MTGISCLHKNILAIKPKDWIICVVRSTGQMEAVICQLGHKKDKNSQLWHSANTALIVEKYWTITVMDIRYHIAYYR